MSAKLWQVGDCIGDMHGANWGIVKHHLETGEKPYWPETQGLCGRIKSVIDIVGFDTDRGHEIIAAATKKGVGNKFVYVIGTCDYEETPHVVVAAYCYDGRHMGIARIVLKECDE